MDELTIKIVMILFPGIITTMFLDKFTEHKPWGNFRYTLYIVFYGILSYVSLQAFILVSDLKNILYQGLEKFEFIKYTLKIWDFGKIKDQVPYDEVVYASLSAVVIAMLTSSIEKTEFFSKLLVKFRITDKYGSYSTFYQLARKNQDEYIDIFIPERNQMYRGIIYSLNEKDDECEFYLCNVIYYRIDGEGNPMPVYKTDELSLSCKYNEFILLTPNKPYEEV